MFCIIFRMGLGGQSLRTVPRMLSTAGRQCSTMIATVTPRYRLFVLGLSAQSFVGRWAKEVREDIPYLRCDRFE